MNVFLYLLIFILSLNLISARDLTQSKFSPRTSLLLQKYNSLGVEGIINNNEIREDNIIYAIEGEYHIGALILLHNSNNLYGLDSYNVRIGAVINDIISVKIPLKNLFEVAKLESIKYLQIDEPVGLHLDLTTPFTGLDILRLSETGVALGGFRGNNVIVGVIDQGFDFTHPAFRDRNNNSRISRVWLQFSTNQPRPRAYTYGTELIGNAISNFRRESTSESHGTHVASTAAGGRTNFTGQYEGIATDAEIVLVSPTFNDGQIKSTGFSTILDGIKYIFDYAKDQRKPAVVNISLGLQIGPHDGTALFDRACNNLTSPGYIIVTSAGNDGGIPGHIRANLSEGAVRTMPLTIMSGRYKAIIDIWGQQNADFCFRVGVLNGNIINWQVNEAYCTNQYLSRSVNISPNNVLIDFTTSGAEFNLRPRIYMDINSSQISQIILEVSGEGVIDMWHCGAGGSRAGAFFKPNIDGFIGGQHKYMIAELGGNADGIITVGSYQTRRTFLNFAGQNVPAISNASVGDLASFSSYGPTSLEKMKPDITAPGSVVIAAGNSFDINMQPAGQLAQYVVSRAPNENNYYFVAMEGTSMSTPIVTGAIALMLEANPFLTVEQIKYIFEQTSIVDNFTERNQSTPNNLWGYGKLNIKEAVVLAESMFTGGIFGNLKAKIFPNPNNGVFSLLIEDEISGEFIFEIHDVLGAKVYSERVLKLPEEELLFPFDLEEYGVAPGAYNLSISIEGQVYNERILFVK